MRVFDGCGLPQIRRGFQPGGFFFFADGRRPLFAEASAQRRLESCFRKFIALRPFPMPGVVVLPYLGPLSLARRKMGMPLPRPFARRQPLDTI